MSPRPEIQLSLGLNFVRSLPPDLPEGTASDPRPYSLGLQNVVPLSAAYRWLDVRIGEVSPQFDPGKRDPTTGYALAPFSAFLEDLVGGLSTPELPHHVELFRMDHVLEDGRWVRGQGHTFRLLANGGAHVQSANLASEAFDVEILISVRVGS